MTLAIINYLTPLDNLPIKLHEQENRLSKFHSFISKINGNFEGKLYQSKKKTAGYLPENTPRWDILSPLNTQKLQKAIFRLP